MSPSVVLVLKLVSTTHVMPTTGIVISDNGLVLVSAEFALSDGEIIVLDGGTDIVKNGRPASLVQHSESDGLAVLSVKGLQRPGITLSENTLNAGTELQLTAFPPAEFIAKGAPPLWAPIKMVQGDTDSQLSISPATPLPYVSGAILDACGYLTGVSLTSGPQSIEPGNLPLTIFADEFRRVLDSMQIKLPMANCDNKAQQAMLPVIKVEKADKKPANESSDPDLVGPEVYRPVIEQKRLNPFQGRTPRPDGNENNGKNTGRPSLWFSIPWWLPLLVITGLAALIWKGYFFYRRHKNDKKQTSPSGSVSSHSVSSHSGSMGQPASSEPDTAPLHEVSGKPRSAPHEDAGLPDMNALPDGCNGVLVIDCLIDTDNRLRRFCVVNTEQVKIVIGRGDADISIEHPMISRAHARLESDGALMTLSDLGSSWGTAINGVPCLPGEVMVIDITDEIFLGDVRLHITVLKNEVGAS